MRVAALLLILGLMGCSAWRRPEPVVDRSQDARILREVEARIAAEPGIEPGLRVEVEGGIVLLYGSVRGLGAWNCALRNAQLVDGVRTVVDYLVLERGPRDIVCHAPSPSG